MSIIETLFKKSLQIFKQDGIIGLLKKRREYYEVYPPVRKNFYYWLYSKLKYRKRVLKRINGFDMYLNLKDYGLSKQLWINGFREPECTRIFDGMLKKDDIVIDIGANIGYYVLLESKIVSRVFAIEPLPENRSFLLLNLVANKIDNVNVYPYAISNYVGEQSFYVGKRKNQANMFLGNDALIVHTVTLDCFCKQNNINPTVIRMDIEGFEYYAIDGMINTLRNNDCRLFFEIHPFQMVQQGLDWRKPLAQLEGLGYKSVMVVKEFGSIKEQSFEGSELYNIGIEPEVYSHGFGLFMEKIN